MMKIAKNAALVLVLAGLLVLPVMGFGFISPSTETEVAPDVLGVQTEKPAVQKVVVPASLDSKEITVQLSNEESQKIYSVVPDEFPANEFSAFVVVPDRFKALGLVAELVKNDLSTDLVLTVPQALREETVTLTLVMMKL